MQWQHVIVRAMFVTFFVTAIVSCLTGQEWQMFWTGFVTLCLAGPALSDHLCSREELERWAAESAESAESDD